MGESRAHRGDQWSGGLGWGGGGGTSLPGGRIGVGPAIRSRRVQIDLSLQELASRVKCAKSYLSAIENERRGVPGDELLAKLEEALMLPKGRLIEAANWQRSLEAGGPAVREELQKKEVQLLAARQLAAMVSRRSGMSGSPAPRTGGGAPAFRGGLDEAYRTGELKRLVDVISPEAARSSGTSPTHPDAQASAEGVVAPGGERGGGGAAVVKLPMQVPLINSVAAGYPREFTDLAYPARVADEYVSCPDLHDPDAFAARVVGDSMMPAYAEGDIVIFSPMRNVKNGSDCFARLEPDHDTTFKRVYFETSPSGEELIRLQPLNSTYAPRVVPREQVAGLYAAVSVMRRIV